MLGSSASIATPNVMINTAVAEVLSDFADRLEGAEDFNSALHDLIRDTIKAHKRIIFNGNGYGEEWILEAERRGLSNLRTTPDAMAHFADEKNAALFLKHKVFSLNEITSRYRIILSNYCKVNIIEALTMIEMARRELIPAISKYAKTLSESVLAKRSLALDPPVSTDYEERVVKRLSALASAAFTLTDELESKVIEIRGEKDVSVRGDRVRDELCSRMECLREMIDEAESITDRAYWPVPTYGELLYGVR